jgi:hypothetical protein
MYRIFVNDNLKTNRASPVQRPVFRVLEEGGYRDVVELLIEGPSRLVYRPNSPIETTHVVAWIETEGPLKYGGAS